MTTPEVKVPLREGDWQLGAVLIAAVSFTLWIYSMGDHVLLLPPCFEQTACDKNVTWVAALALLLWALRRPQPSPPDPGTEGLQGL